MERLLASCTISESLIDASQCYLDCFDRGNTAVITLSLCLPFIRLKYGVRKITPSIDIYMGIR